MMHTKELIYLKAKELFIEHGYDNVGMREIAKQSGIKAASIYAHYQSKDAILSQIATELVGYMKNEIYPLYKQPLTNYHEFFTNISINTIKFFERDNINLLTNLLFPTINHSQAVRKMFEDEFIIKPRSALAYHFKRLIDQGKMKNVDPMLAAKIYHSFFVYHFYEKYSFKKQNDYLTSRLPLFFQHIEIFINCFEIK